MHHFSDTSGIFATTFKREQKHDVGSCLLKKGKMKHASGNTKKKLNFFSGELPF
jgi:hypothetical protein